MKRYAPQGAYPILNIAWGLECLQWGGQLFESPTLPPSHPTSFRRLGCGGEDPRGALARRFCAFFEELRSLKAIG